MLLQERELLSIEGGGSPGLAMIIGGLIILLLGVLDGYYNSIKCGKRR